MMALIDFLGDPRGLIPVLDEVTETRLEVVGEIPECLRGTFVRNGPNSPNQLEDGKSWFDGDGMLHSVTITSKGICYKNRWVLTDKFLNVTDKQFGLNDAPSMRRLNLNNSQITNPANTSVLNLQGDYFALWEGDVPYEFSLENLRTLGKCKSPPFPSHPFTAHPKIDPSTGDLHCFGYSPAKPYLSYSIINSTRNVLSTSSIELPRPVMMHDFAITSQYTLFMDHPAIFGFANRLRGKSLVDFRPELPSRIGILNRTLPSLGLKWISMPSCFVFHVLNAFQTQSEITLVACRYQRFPEELMFNSPLRPLSDGHTDSSNYPRLHKWVINLCSDEVEEICISDIPCEMPRINERFIGLENRYGYAVEYGGRALIKFDLATNKAVRFSHGKNRFGGEPVFVAAPQSTHEDDGWILSFVYDAMENKSELVIVCASSFSNSAIARIRIPHRVPYGLHATWFPELS